MLQSDAGCKRAFRLLLDDISLPALVDVILGTGVHTVLVGVHQVEDVAQEFEADTAVFNGATVLFFPLPFAQSSHHLRHCQGCQRIKCSAGTVVLGVGARPPPKPDDASQVLQAGSHRSQLQ